MSGRKEDTFVWEQYQYQVVRQFTKGRDEILHDIKVPHQNKRCCTTRHRAHKVMTHHQDYLYKNCFIRVVMSYDPILCMGLFILQCLCQVRARED